MIGYSKKNREIVRENAFNEKKKRPGLKFNPGLALIGLRKTGPWVLPKIKIWAGYLICNKSLRVSQIN